MSLKADTRATIPATRTGLYAIVDLALLEQQRIPPLEFAIEVLRARPPLLQLRAKRAAPRTVLGLLRALGPLCRRTGTLLFANDRPDLALAGDCDGVHVGQDDLAVRDVRQVGPGLLVGLSTHNLVQVEAALQEAPDYVAFGPVFPTASKQDPDPVVGLEGLREAAARARRARCPLVAIGGIDIGRAPAVAGCGVLGAAIGALMPKSRDLGEVAALAIRLQQALGG